MIRIVAAVLLVWEPLNLASEALAVLPTIVHRGWLAGAELALHGLVAALAAAGGLALWNRTPHAPRLASVGIIASLARTIQSLYWSTLPRGTMPGDEALTALIAVSLAVVALTVVFRSSARLYQ